MRYALLAAGSGGETHHEIFWSWPSVGLIVPVVAVALLLALLVRSSRRS